MDDVIFVGVFVGMMALAFGYVRVCERIVRSDSVARTSPAIGATASIHSWSA